MRADALNWRSWLWAKPDHADAPAGKGPADAILYATVIALIAFGVVMVYSASGVFAARASSIQSGHHFLVRQAVFALVAIPTMIGVARIDYRRYRIATYPILASVVALLFVVAVGLGHTAGGSARWISLGPIHIQPAEMAKLALIFWLAYSLSKKQEKIKSFSVGFLPHALMALFLILLCLRQPDFGSAVMIALLTFVLLFSAGAKLGYILGAAFAAAPVVFALIASSPYRMRRIHAFLTPFENRSGAGYQVYESLLCFGSGGVTGVGLGNSRQKLLFLPAAHTDFIGAIVAEELGLIGILCLIAAFLIVFSRGMRTALRAPDDYGRYLAIGITMFLALQAFVNLAVVMGMLPTKGLACPFISYGGSSLLVNAAAVGVLLNISRWYRGPRELEVDRGKRRRTSSSESEAGGAA